MFASVIWCFARVYQVHSSKVKVTHIAQMLYLALCLSTSVSVAWGSIHRFYRYSCSVISVLKHVMI